jgi:hypothetical protein
MRYTRYELTATSRNQNISPKDFAAWYPGLDGFPTRVSINIVVSLPVVDRGTP